MSQAYSSDDKTIHLWACGAIADYVMYAMFALISFFFVTTFGVNPATVGNAIFIPRICDAIADPIIGYISDNTHTRWGRRRPFILGSGLVGVGLVAGLFWMPPNWASHQWWAFTYIAVMSTALFVCWGTYTMNHLALGYELSDDYHQRTKVLAVRGAYFSVAGASGGWYYWLAERPVFGGEIPGMRIVAGVISVVALISVLVVTICSRERFQRANRKHVNIFKAIWATLNVKPFLILVSLRIFQTLGASLYGAVGVFITVYTVCNADKPTANFLSGINGFVGLGMSILLVPFAAKLSKGIGKRRGLILGYAMTFISACFLPFFARQGMPYLLLTHMIIFAGIFGVILAVFQGAVMPDICDIDELKSGERREGLFSAVNSFISKVETSVCAWLGLHILQYTGFHADLAKKGLQQPVEVLEKMRWWGFTPLIIFTGLAFLLSWLYPVTEKYMAEVREQLDARRRAGLAQEGAAGVDGLGAVDGTAG